MRGRPFQKGQSGNPGGRPRTADFSQAIRGYLATPLPGKRDKTRLDALIERLYKKDPKTLLAYAFGKPIETHEIGGDGSEGVRFIQMRHIDPARVLGLACNGENKPGE